MPDFSKLDQCAMISQALYFIPPPARAPIAVGLYDLGMRLHPELATKGLVQLGPAGMGAHRRQRLVDVNSQRDGMAFLRDNMPALAAKIEAATTPAAKQAAMADIQREYPEIVAQAGTLVNTRVAEIEAEIEAQDAEEPPE